MQHTVAFVSITNWVMGCLLLCATVIHVSAAEWLVNPNPEEVTACMRIRDEQRLVRLPGLQCVPLSKALPVDPAPVKIEPCGKGFRLAAASCALVVDQEGIQIAEIKEKTIKMKAAGKVPFSVEADQGGGPLTAGVVLKSTNSNWRVSLRADGIVELEGKGPLTIQGPDDCAMWCWKPYGGLGWTKTRGKGAFHFHGEQDIESRVLYARSLFPGEVTAVGTETGDAILLVRPEEPEAQVGVNVSKATITLGEEGASRRFSLLLASSATEARRLCVNGQAPFLVAGEGPIFEGACPWGDNWKMRVEDINGNGPDFVSDVWTVTRGGAVRGRVAFGKADGALKADFFKDLNKDGKLDGIEAAYPVLRAMDWNGDGKVFEGPVFYGGFLQQDRCLWQQGEPDVIWDNGAEAYDLDGDGDWDIIRNDSALNLDYYDRDIGFHIRPCFFDVVKQNRYDKPDGPQFMVMSWFLITHTAGGSPNMSGFREGGLYQISELHFSCKLDEQDPQPEAKFRAVAAGNIYADLYDTPAISMARLTMANLDRKPRTSGYDWQIQFSSFREGQQPINMGEALHVERLVKYRDAFGHELKVRSPLIPSGAWKGEKLPFRQFKRGWDNVDSCPWALMANASYPYVYCLFEPEGVEGEAANEGLHNWVIQRMLSRRWEVNPRGTDGKAPLTLYYSPLFGALQHKGARWGMVNAPHYWDNKLNRPGKDGTPFCVGTGRSGGNLGDTHRHRLWGLLFLEERDLDGDGYFDFYLWDKENDGKPDTLLWHLKDRGVVRAWQPGHLAEWPMEVASDEVPYLLERYTDVARLYQKGLPVDPLVQRVAFDETGLPQVDGKTPEGAKKLDASAMSAVAVDAFHSGIASPWSEFRPEGLLRTASLLSAMGFRLTTLEGSWSAESLKGLRLLIVPAWKNPPSEAEWRALQGWLQSGGRLLMLNTTEDDDSAAVTSVLAEGWGIRSRDETLDRLAIVWRRPDYVRDEGEMRACTAANRVDRFASSERGLFDGLHYLSFRGRPLTVRGGAGALLSYDGQALVAEARVGRGRVFVSDADWFSNRVLCHPSGIQSEAAPWNFDLVERMLVLMAGPDIPVKPARFFSPWETLRLSAPLSFGSCPEEGYQVLKADNGMVEIKVYPELGGKMMFYGAKGAANQMQTYSHRWNLDVLKKLSPGLPGMSPAFFIDGGLNDLAYRDFQGSPVWWLPYQGGKKDGGVWVELTDAGVRHRRVMTPLPGRSELQIDASQENVAAGDLYLQVRNNPTFAVGGDAGPEDMFIFQSKKQKGKVEKQHYVRGGNERGLYLDPSLGWAAVVDTAKDEAMVFRFNGADYTSGFFWLGPIADYETVPAKPVFETDPRGGLYTFELVTPAMRAKPGERMERTARWQLLRGIRDIDGVGTDTVVDLAPSRDAVKPGESLTCTVTVASAGSTGPLQGVLRLAQAVQNFHLDPVAPGRASRTTVTIAAPEADGIHQLKVEVREGDQVRVEGETAIRVAQAEIVSLETDLNLVKKVLASMEKAAESSLEKLAGKAVIERRVRMTEESLARNDLAGARLSLERAKAWMKP